MPDPLPSDLAEALSADTALRDRVDLRYFAEVGSTNDLVLALADAGAPEGTAVLADAQRAGRGRRGRTWFSPPGAGMYLSCVVRNDAGGWPLPLVTLAAGVAAAQSITNTTGLPVELKWPNDVVTGDAWRKLAGILCESSGTRGRVDAVVVGIGVNLRPAAYPPDVQPRATSIETELGRPIERAPLVAACLRELLRAVDDLRRHDRSTVIAAWRRLGARGLDGAPVRWQDQGVERRGRTRGIDDNGALIVDTGGRAELIVAGEVMWDRTS